MVLKLEKAVKVYNQENWRIIKIADENWLFVRKFFGEIDNNK